MDNSSQIDSIILEKVNKYIIDNYVEDIEDNGDLSIVIDEKDVSNLVINYSTFEKPFGLKNIKKKLMILGKKMFFILLIKRIIQILKCIKEQVFLNKHFQKLDVMYFINRIKILLFKFVLD